MEKLKDGNVDLYRLFVVISKVVFSFCLIRWKVTMYMRLAFTKYLTTKSSLLFPKNFKIVQYELDVTKNIKKVSD